MTSAWLLAGLGALSAGVSANARWPSHRMPFVIPSWFLAMFAVEFAIHLLAIGAVIVAVLVARCARLTDR